MIKAGIIGATGFTGAELVRLLYSHPEVEISVLTSRSYAGVDIADVYPNLKGLMYFLCSDQDVEEVFSISDVVFVALPHGYSVPIVSMAEEKEKKVIDLGADFRLKEASVYEKWYGLEHKSPELLHKAVYGLPEIYKEYIQDADFVANPGCFPTSVILATAPLLAENFIEADSIIVDSKTGISGAGKTPSEKTHFVERNENVGAYGVLAHRHKPEIEQELSLISGNNINFSFTPHLVPITRGILSTVYARLKR